MLPGTPDLQALYPLDAQEQVQAGPRYLIGWLAKFGALFPPGWPASNPGLRQERPQDEPAIPEPEALVPEESAESPALAQEPEPQLGRMAPGPEVLNLSNQPYCFPVALPFSFRDSWGDPRAGGRVHRATDIIAPEGTPVYAVTNGVIDILATWPGAGITLLMRGQDGRGYGYMHLHSYAPGIMTGKPVRTGELIGYVGRTGVIESAAHLHFQVYADHRLCKDELLNPYYFLVQLCHGVGVTDLSQLTTTNGQPARAAAKSQPDQGFQTSGDQQSGGPR